MRLATGLFALLSGAIFGYATWRSSSCGYDCGIFSTEPGGSGPAVVVVWLLSSWVLIGSLIAFVAALFLRRRAARSAPQAWLLGNTPLFYDERLRTWQHSGIEFWGLPQVEISITASDAGPSPEQVAEFGRLSRSKDLLLPRMLGALRTQEAEPAEFVLVGLHIPRLDHTPAGELGRFWFDRLGDDHFLYGVETTDRWQTLRSYRDD